MNTQASIDRVCKMRGLGDIKRGTPCEVDGRKGIVVGGNDSANLNVLFEDSDAVSSCHPDYRMRVLNPWGGCSWISDDIDGQHNTGQEVGEK